MAKPASELNSRRAGATAAFLPPSAVITVKLSPPPLSGAKLRRILPALLASELPFPADVCVWRFERSGASVLAHVARRSDVAAALTGPCADSQDLHGPRFLVPPGPIAWRLACAERPLPALSPRAVVFLLGEGQGVLAAGRGDDLESVFVFNPASPGECAIRLRMALGADFSRAAVTVGGVGAAKFVASLPEDMTATVASDPDSFGARALGLRPALAALDLRAPAAAAGAVAAHPLQDRARDRAVIAVAGVVLAASVFFCAFERANASFASSALRFARNERRFMVDSLAGYRVSSRGEAAVREAVAAAISRRDSTLALPNASTHIPAVAAVAQSTGVRVSHLELRSGGVAASGTAPDTAAAHRFVEELRGAGLRAAMSEAPKTVATGGVAFFVQPSGEDAQ